MRGQTRDAWRWALRDVELEVAPGEAVGLIGSNGSGKSTLLKLLNGVMYPTAGNVRVTGRIGSLIEVRAGIHPDLTGRENAYLYGSLLGLGRKGVTAKLDQIVEFAQLENAINRQVKFYSSGMQMRLGFAVAAFLEPDVLLVDEVLAVGDASFQQRCLQRMSEVHASGTTLVLVSHDLAAVESMCTRVLWLEQSYLRADGPAREVVAAYRHAVELQTELEADNDGEFRISAANIRRVDGAQPSTYHPLRITFSILSPTKQDSHVYIGVTEGTAPSIFTCAAQVTLEEGVNRLECVVDHLPLPRGSYSVWACATDDVGRFDLSPWHPIGSFDVMGPEPDDLPRAIVRLSAVQVRSTWEVKTPPSG